MPTAGGAGIVGKLHDHRVVMIHAGADLFGEREKRLHTPGVERRTGDRLDRAPLAPFPQDSAAAGIGQGSAIEERPQAAGIAAIAQQLRQNRRHAAGDLAKHLRANGQMPLPGAPPLIEIGLDLSRCAEVERPGRKPPADDCQRSLLQTGANLCQRSRIAGRQCFDDFSSGHDSLRHGRVKFSFEGHPDGRRCQQHGIEEPDIDRIIV
jgi:hypothetical protein